MVGLVLTKLGIFILSGYGQTDTISESSHRNMSTRQKFHVKAQYLELAIDRMIFK